MHSFTLLTKCTIICLVMSLLISRTSGYFLITEPTAKTRWTVGTPGSVSWLKGVEDGISVFDVEIARLSQDGLTFVAKNVPASQLSLNILLEDVPVGDDYFLLFMNSTHGAMHATSPRFSVVAAGSASDSDSEGPIQPSAISDVETVTVSGAPNPTRPFATTFAALENGVCQSWGNPGQAWGFGTVVLSCLIGFAWTLW